LQEEFELTVETNEKKGTSWDSRSCETPHKMGEASNESGGTFSDTSEDKTENEEE
jgi:hypothetical protein